MPHSLPSEAKALTLTTPARASKFGVYVDGGLLVICKETRWTYPIQCVQDLCEMLKKRGDWMRLGSRGEENDANPDTVEAWARSVENPIRDYYGMTNGRRGRFASFVPPVLEYLKLAEVEHKPRNNSMRAL